MDNVLKNLYSCFKKVNKKVNKKFLKTDNLLKLVFMLNKVNKNFLKTILYSCFKKVNKKVNKNFFKNNLFK